MGINNQAVIMIRPPQRDRVLLHFDGANGATSTTDVYQNTVVVNGAAVLATAEKRFGSASLNCPNPENDYVNITGPTSLGSASWTMECWAYWPTLAGNYEQTLFSALSELDFGLRLSYLSAEHPPAPLNLRLNLSSNNSTWNIANNADVLVGTGSGNWIHFAATYDASAGHYYTYADGVNMHDITSALVVNPINRIIVGAASGGLAGMRGQIDEFRLSNVCRYPGGTTFTPPAAAFVS